LRRWIGSDVSISIVVATLDRPDELRQCLSHLAGQESPGRDGRMRRMGVVMPSTTMVALGTVVMLNSFLCSMLCFGRRSLNGQWEWTSTLLPRYEHRLRRCIRPFFATHLAGVNWACREPGI
jgi:hypothetical protein